MNNNRKGFTPIAIVLLAVAIVAIVGVGAYYYFKASSAPTVQQPGNNNPPVVVTSTTPIATPTSTLVATTTPSGGFIMMPDNGPVGVSVTIYGSGFAATGNTVTMNGMVGGSLKDIASNGKSITFTIPSSLGPNCKSDQACPQYLLEVTPRTYAIAVISDGVTQNIGNFTVIASGTPIGL